MIGRVTISIRFISSVAALALLSGCSTVPSKNKIDRDTKLSINIETAGLLYSRQVLDGETAVRAFTQRVQKYLAHELNKQHVETERSGVSKPGDARATIEMTSIESVAGMKPTPWVPTSVQHAKINYNLTVLTPEGSTALTFDDRDEDESLDDLSKRIARRMADRIAKCYR